MEEGTWRKWEGEVHEATTHSSSGDRTGIFTAFLWNRAQTLVVSTHKPQEGHAEEDLSGNTY